ncbi:hypothetical protein APHAL10511_001010 [Amanita phalloides]|nr:hypothetical protein APHAL10511_001010 [Amanita phalloides]
MYVSLCDKGLASSWLWTLAFVAIKSSGHLNHVEPSFPSNHLFHVNMRFSLALASLLTAASAASAAQIAISVGANGTLAYSPSNITAAAGDVVLFTFAAKNHTVTQSTFPDPCVKASANAIDSGFEPVANGSATLPTFAVTVNDTKPLWFYCKQKNPVSHCHAGMVFAINAPANATFAQFQAAAENSTTGGNTTSTSSSTAATPTKSSGALGRNGNAAGMLILAGLVAGITL